jgi:hypothetical protein
VDGGRRLTCETSVIAESLIEDTVITEGTTRSTPLISEIRVCAEWTGYACSVGDHQILSVIRTLRHTLVRGLVESHVRLACQACNGCNSIRSFRCAICAVLGTSNECLELSMTRQ